MVVSQLLELPEPKNHLLPSPYHVKQPQFLSQTMLAQNHHVQDRKLFIWHVICIPKRTNVIKKPHVRFQDFLEQYEAQQISNPILSVPQQFLVGKKAGKVKKWHVPNLVSSNECAVVPFKNVILPPQNNFSQLSS